MARAAFHLRTQLTDLICHDEADGIGAAEPYLWPVFFKIDGDSFAVDAVGLIGFPTIKSTNGNHRNLGDSSVGEDDQVAIPAALGTQTTLFKPIPVNDPSFRIILGDDLPAIAGVVVVLMEQDGWPNDLAVTGYKALIDAVTLGVAQAAASFQHNAAPPSQADIDEQIGLIKDLAEKMVKGAILEKMSGAQTAWYGTIGNNDDKIGSEVFTVTQDDFVKANTKASEARWKEPESGGDGDWSITVRFTNLDGPPPVVDPNQCAKLAAQINALEDSLADEPDINERKRILIAMGQLRDRSSQLGCPRD